MRLTTQNMRSVADKLVESFNNFWNYKICFFREYNNAEVGQQFMHFNMHMTIVYSIKSGANNEVALCFRRWLVNTFPDIEACVCIRAFQGMKSIRLTHSFNSCLLYM